MSIIFVRHSIVPIVVVGINQFQFASKKYRVGISINM